MEIISSPLVAVTVYVVRGVVAVGVPVMTPVVALNVKPGGVLGLSERTSRFPLPWASWYKRPQPRFRSSADTKEQSEAHKLCVSLLWLVAADGICGGNCVVGARHSRRRCAADHASRRIQGQAALRGGRNDVW